jgi:hypothetical protein
MEGKNSAKNPPVDAGADKASPKKRTPRKAGKSA